MSDPEPLIAAERAVFWQALKYNINKSYDAARRDAERALSAAAIGSQLVLDASGEPLGTVAWKPDTMADPAVLDPRALLAWVKRNRPDEVVVVESVRESYVNALIDNAKRQPERKPIDPGTGAIVPGIAVPPGDGGGRLTVRPTPEARMRVSELLESASGSLRSLGGSPGVPEGAENA
jgi:hypothetical protein